MYLGQWDVSVGGWYPTDTGVYSPGEASRGGVVDDILRLAQGGVNVWRQVNQPAAQRPVTDVYGRPIIGGTVNVSQLSWLPWIIGGIAVIWLLRK